MMEKYRDPFGIEDDEIEKVSVTFGGKATYEEGDAIEASSAISAARRLLKEKKDLIDNGATRPVYKWKEGQGEIVKPYWLTAKGPAPWVSVRPCADKYDNKTFLGILVGEVALSVDFTDGGPGDEPGTAITCISRSFYNPLILIPEINETVLGCGSFWKEIKSPDDLKRITDVDINSVWYIKMLKEMEKSGG